MCSPTQEASFGPIVVQNDPRFSLFRVEVQVQLSAQIDGRNCAVVHPSMLQDAALRQAVSGPVIAEKKAAKSLLQNRGFDPIKLIAGACRQNRNDMHRFTYWLDHRRIRPTVVSATPRFT